MGRTVLRLRLEEGRENANHAKRVSGEALGVLVVLVAVAGAAIGSDVDLTALIHETQKMSQDAANDLGLVDPRRVLGDGFPQEQEHGGIPDRGVHQGCPAVHCNRRF